MFTNHLTLEDFAQGFAGDNSGQEMLKAMQAGQITGRETEDLALTMEPLKPESLERTLKNLEFRTQDLKMFNAIPKMAAYNTVEEFVQLYSYGAERGGFYPEGALSSVEDSKYIRRSELVKYMQVTGSVTMQAQMVRSFVQAMSAEVESKMKWILRLANKSICSADSNVVPEQFNGLYKQHMSVGTGQQHFFWPSLDKYFASEVVVDLRGKSLTQNHVENAAIIVDDNFGTPDKLFAPPKVISALAQDYYKDQRIIQNAGSGYTGTIGTVPKVIATSIGDIALESDKSLKAPTSRNSASPSDPNAPTAPVVSTVALRSDVTSKHNTTTDNPSAQNVYYAVAAINSFGESGLTVNSTAIVVATGQAVDITIAAGAGGNEVTGFAIYRTEPTANVTPAGLEFHKIFSVSATEVIAGYNGAGAGKVADKGYFLPNTEQCFVTQWDEEVVSFKQLAPISKLDLAVVAMSRQFITFLFGTPNLYAPRKLVRFVNVSKKYVATP